MKGKEEEEEEEGGGVKKKSCRDSNGRLNKVECELTISNVANLTHFDLRLTSFFIYLFGVSTG